MSSLTRVPPSVKPAPEPTVADWIDYARWAARMDAINAAYDAAREEALAEQYRPAPEPADTCLAGYADVDDLPF